jgi:hypothetical protein
MSAFSGRKNAVNKRRVWNEVLSAKTRDTRKKGGKEKTKEGKPGQVTKKADGGKKLMTLHTTHRYAREQVV